MAFGNLFKPNIDKLEAKKDIGGLVKALSNKKNPDTRRKAAGALSRIAGSQYRNSPPPTENPLADAVDPLIAALQDDNKSVRSSSAEALGYIGDARAIEPLITSLKDKEEYVRGEAARALGTYPDASVVESLMVALRDESSYVRSMSANSLEKIGTPAVPMLLLALENTDLSIRIVAAKLLAGIGDPQTIPNLLRVFQEDEHDAMRLAAALALGGVNTQALDLLLIAVDSDVHVISLVVAENMNIELSEFTAATTLRSLPPAVQQLFAQRVQYTPIIKLVQLGRNVIRDQYGNVDNDLPAVGCLQFLFESEIESARTTIIKALAKSGDRRVVKRLITALESEDSSMASTAAKGLGKIGDREAVKSLSAALKREDGNRNVAYSAAVALGEIGDASATGPLLGALTSDDILVRLGAEEALGKIGLAARPALKAESKTASGKTDKTIHKLIASIESANTIEVDPEAFMARIDKDLKSRLAPDIHYHIKLAPRSDNGQIMGIEYKSGTYNLTFLPLAGEDAKTYGFTLDYVVKAITDHQSGANSDLGPL